MASNVRDFNLTVKRFGDEIPALVEARHRALTLEALKGVVLMSPVDKGRFRGNWQVTIGEPAQASLLDALDKAGSVTIAKGAEVIAQAKAFSITWIVNNLAYANELEKGHSKQAPAGMVAITMARLRNMLARR
jgi:hypothetical protein